MGKKANHFWAAMLRQDCHFCIFFFTHFGKLRAPFSIPPYHILLISASYQWCLLLSINSVQRSSILLLLMQLGHLCIQHNKLLPLTIQEDLQHVLLVVAREHPQSLGLCALSHQLQQRYSINMAPVVHAINCLIQVLHLRSLHSTSYCHRVCAVL